jgi:SAM-dependent methyltransferase
MNESQIRFDDGAAYEGYMGVWSRLAGEEFLRWLAPQAGAHWLDVGCGNGAFTELLLARAAAAHVEGIDPSPEQLAFARQRLAGQPARFQAGDAVALPFADGAFDAAVMALVIFFVPDPARGVAEMARVVKAGGSVSAYAWDMLGGGFPYAAVREEMSALGAPMLAAPSPEASGIDALRELWAGAGLVDVETRAITVRRSFDDFEAFWRTAQTGPRMAPRIAAMDKGDVARLEQRLRARLLPDADGRITYGAIANAVKGRVAR